MPVVIENARVVMELDDAMHFRLAPAEGETIVVDGWAEIVIDGEVADHFTLEVDSVRREKATTDLGPAQRLTVSGVADLPGGGRLRRVLTVEAYPQWPNALILQARYENLSDAPVKLDSLAEPALQLDSSRTDSARKPNDFWSFQGAAVGWGQDFAAPVPAFLARDNYLGHLDGAEGGGIPVVYVWNQQMGVALAHVEPVPQLWYMPVRGGSRNGVRLALETREPDVIPPGGSVAGLRTLLSVHQGDFYEPLALYADILAAQGLDWPSRTLRTMPQPGARGATNSTSGRKRSWALFPSSRIWALPGPHWTTAGSTGTATGTPC